MYAELDAMFPDHYYFYEVVGTMGEALEKCGRLTLDAPQVFNHNGVIVFASKQNLGTDISWLKPVAGTPVDAESSEA